MKNDYYCIVDTDKREKSYLFIILCSRVNRFASLISARATFWKGIFWDVFFLLSTSLSKIKYYTNKDAFFFSFEAPSSHPRTPAWPRREQPRQTFHQHPIKQQTPLKKKKKRKKMLNRSVHEEEEEDNEDGGGAFNMNSLLPTVTLPLSALRVAAVKPAPTCICTLNPKLPLCLSCAGGDRSPAATAANPLCWLGEVSLSGT